MTWRVNGKCTRGLILLYLWLYSSTSVHWIELRSFIKLFYDTTPVLWTIKAYLSPFSQESSSHVMQWCLLVLTLRTVCLISVALVAPQWHCAKLFKAMLTCVLKLGCQLTGGITPSVVSVWALQTFCKAPLKPAINCILVTFSRLCLCSVHPSIREWSTSAVCLFSS